jgi:hypothetical protein
MVGHATLDNGPPAHRTIPREPAMDMGETAIGTAVFASAAMPAMA